MRRLLGAIALALCACAPDGLDRREAVADSLPIAQRLTWGGLSPAAYARTDSPPDIAADSLQPIAVHRLDFPGESGQTVWLREYARDYWAYAAFQIESNESEMSQGIRRRGDSLHFLHGTYLGSLAFPSARSLQYGLDQIVFRAEPIVLRPQVFLAFPLQGRISHSDRVIPRNFQGRPWIGPVFTSRYLCHDDTATAFRASPQAKAFLMLWLRDVQGRSDTLDWGRKIRFTGWDEFRQPLVFWSFPGGVVGFAGCYDPELAGRYAEKMEKMTILVPNR